MSRLSLANKQEKLFHWAAQQVMPAVVFIQSTQTVKRVVTPQKPFGGMFLWMSWACPMMPFEEGGPGAICNARNDARVWARV